MAPKFPNPDPATDSVRGRLNQFIEVAGRAVYPPLAVAPSPTTPGQVWWDISDTVKIRDEANTDWASLATTMGAVSFKEAQTLTSGEKTQALTNIGAQPAGSYQPAGGYVRYDDAQTLTSPQRAQAAVNIEAVSYGQAQALTDPQKTQARANTGAGIPTFLGITGGGAMLPGVAYTNPSPSLPLNVEIFSTNISGAHFVELYIRQSTGGGWVMIGKGWNEAHARATGIIPAGWQYKFEGTSGANGLWMY